MYPPPPTLTPTFSEQPLGPPNIGAGYRENMDPPVSDTTSLRQGAPVYSYILQEHLCFARSNCCVLWLFCALHAVAAVCSADFVLCTLQLLCARLILCSARCSYCVLW